MDIHTRMVQFSRRKKKTSRPPDRMNLSAISTSSNSSSDDLDEYGIEYGILKARPCKEERREDRRLRKKRRSESSLVGRFSGRKKEHRSTVAPIAPSERASEEQSMAIKTDDMEEPYNSVVKRNTPETNKSDRHYIEVMLDKTDGREDFYKLKERFNRKFLKVAPECDPLSTYKFWEYIRTASVKVEFEDDTPYVIYVDPDATLTNQSNSTSCSGNCAEMIDELRKQLSVMTSQIHVVAESSGYYLQPLSTFDDEPFDETDMFESDLFGI